MGVFRPYLFHKSGHLFDKVTLEDLNYSSRDREGVIFTAKLLNVAAKSTDRQGGLQTDMGNAQIRYGHSFDIIKANFLILSDKSDYTVHTVTQPCGQMPVLIRAARSF